RASVYTLHFGKHWATEGRYAHSPQLALHGRDILQERTQGSARRSSLLLLAPLLRIRSGQQPLVPSSHRRNRRSLQREADARSHHRSFQEISADRFLRRARYLSRAHRTRFARIFFGNFINKILRIGGREAAGENFSRVEGVDRTEYSRRHRLDRDASDVHHEFARRD